MWAPDVGAWARVEVCGHSRGHRRGHPPRPLYSVGVGAGVVTRGATWRPGKVCARAARHLEDAAVVERLSAAVTTYRRRSHGQLEVSGAAGPPHAREVHLVHSTP